MLQLPPFQEWIVQLSQIASNCSVFIASVIAIWGLAQWRRELIGKTKVELTLKIIKLANQLKIDIILFRSDYDGQPIDRVRKDKETSQESWILDMYFWKRERLQVVQNTLQSLNETTWEAEVILGEQDILPIKKLEEMFGELKVAFYNHFSTIIYQDEDGPRLTAIKVPERRLLYSLQPDQDDFGLRVNNTIEELKKQLRKHVKS